MFLATALAAALAAAPVALAKGDPDQSTGEQCCIAGIVGAHNGGPYALAETFTAGRTGFLDTAEMFIYQQGSATGGRYRVRLTGVTADGAPDDQALASAVLDVCRQGRFTTDPPSAVRFSPAPAITAGSHYALVVGYSDDTAPDHFALWAGGAPTFVGGSPWSKDLSSQAPTWQSIGGGSPLSLFTYVSATQPPVQSTTATAASVAATPSTVKRGQPVELHATVVEPGHPGVVPAGDVTFVVDGAVADTAPLGADGTARYTTAFSSAEAHNVIASYCPTAASTLVSSEAAASVTVTTQKWATGTALSVNPDPTVSWQPATFRATVTNSDPDGPAPTGTVQFTEDDGTPIGGPVPLDDRGRAAIDAEAGAGDYVVRARYSGDDLHESSEGTVSQRVVRDTTTVTIVSAASPATVGKPFLIGVAVEADGASEGIPTGTVQLSLAGAPAGPALPLDPDGTVVVEATATRSGTTTVGARYGGDDDFLPSEGRLTQTVDDSPASAPATPTPQPTAQATPLSRAEVLLALRIQPVIAARLRRSFRLGTVTTRRVRKVHVDLLAARAGTTASGLSAKRALVLLGHGKLVGVSIRAKLTVAGRKVLKRRGHARTRLRLHVVDDTGHGTTATLTRMLRLTKRQAQPSSLALRALPQGLAAWTLKMMRAPTMMPPTGPPGRHVRVATPQR